MISFLGRAKYPLVAAILFCLLIAVFFLWNRRPGEVNSYPKSFDGSSEDLKQTVIVPTLDTPFQEGKSAIWCSSFQIAWNKLIANVVKGPIRVGSARFNPSEIASASEADMDPEMFYSEAGWVSDGIVERIQNEMKHKFPDVPKPEFPNLDPIVAVAYAYLKADVQFNIPFLENEKPFHFRGAEGDSTKVASFGIHENTSQKNELRKQIEVMYFNPDDSFEKPKEFAIDPCKDSSPNQVVLAVLPRKQTMGEILKDLEKKIATYGLEEHLHSFGRLDSFLVPNMHWKIKHRFKELEGPVIGPALQVIEFKLDQRGASVSSQAIIGIKGGPRLFHFDRPFLIYMKKRDAKHPFFVMWVDNAELLMRS